MTGNAVIFLLAGGVLCALGALAGILSERRRLHFVMLEQAARNSELRHRLGEAESLLAQIQAENSTMSSFLVVLPDVVRQLNQNKSRRNIPPLLLSTLQHIFEPSHILIYMARGKGELALTHVRGVAPELAQGHKVRFGQGQVGLVAMSQVASDRESFLSDTQARQNSSSKYDLPGVPLDLIAPLVNEGATLGVICVGGIGKRQRDEKRMIKLVADLGSLALRNAAMMTGLENIANADALTELASKRLLNLKLGELTHRAEQMHTPLSLIMLDIDHFKRINDTHGHPAGDGILKAVAKLIKAHLRSEDLPARYGGEEFVAVLPDTTKEDAVRIAEKIRAAVASHAFTVPGRPPTAVHVTVSGGVAAHQVDGQSSSDILAAADQALYLAKQAGRNRIVEYRSRYLSDDEAEVGAAI